MCKLIAIALRPGGHSVKLDDNERPATGRNVDDLGRPVLMKIGPGYWVVSASLLIGYIVWAGVTDRSPDVSEIIYALLLSAWIGLWLYTIGPIILRSRQAAFFAAIFGAAFPAMLASDCFPQYRGYLVVIGLSMLVAPLAAVLVDSVRWSRAHPDEPPVERIPGDW